MMTSPVEPLPMTSDVTAFIVWLERETTIGDWGGMRCAGGGVCRRGGGGEKGRHVCEGGVCVREGGVCRRGG